MRSRDGRMSDECLRVSLVSCCPHRASDGHAVRRRLLPMCSNPRLRPTTRTSRITILMSTPVAFWSSKGFRKDLRVDVQEAEGQEGHGSVEGGRTGGRDVAEGRLTA
eukprot:1659006-Rhodomonas_salina.2